MTEIPEEQPSWESRDSGVCIAYFVFRQIS